MNKYYVSRFITENLQAEGEALTKYEDFLGNVKGIIHDLKERLKPIEISDEDTDDVHIVELEPEERAKIEAKIVKYGQVFPVISEIVADEKNHARKLIALSSIIDDINAAED